MRACVIDCLPLGAFRSRTVPSVLPVMRVCPSGLKTTEVASGSRKCRHCIPVATSQIRTKCRICRRQSCPIRSEADVVDRSDMALQLVHNISRAGVLNDLDLAQGSQSDKTLVRAEVDRKTSSHKSRIQHRQFLVDLNLQDLRTRRFDLPLPMTGHSQDTFRRD